MKSTFDEVFKARNAWAKSMPPDLTDQDYADEKEIVESHGWTIEELIQVEEQV